MISGLYQGTLTYRAEEVTRRDLTPVAGIGMCVPLINMTAVIGGELYIATIGAGVDKTQDEATVICIIGHNALGVHVAGPAVASTSGAALTWRLIVGASVCLTAVVDVYVGTEDLLVDSSAYSTACLTGISVIKADAADYLGTGLEYDLAYEFLQGLLGLGVGGEESFQQLTLLYHGYFVHVKSEHKKWV